MFKVINAELFFNKSGPPFIPADTTPLNLDILDNRIHSLSKSDYPLDELKEILRKGNIFISAGNAALKSIELIDKETVFVICGQQAGLFGGPLYTLYKAMHAIKLASILADRTGKKVIPIFWIASDDHDFEEAGSLGLRTNDGVSLRVEYTPQNYVSGTPVGDIIIDDGIISAIEVLEKHIGSGDFSANYMNIIKSSWQPGMNWPDAFARQISALFSEYGLVVFDPRWDGAKALFREIMTAEINNPTASSNIVNSEADKFESSKKRKKAIRKPKGSTNLFFEEDGIRNPIFFNENYFSAGSSSFSKDEMLELVKLSPEKFSPGAALRPICQDFIFPAAALISGPGERFYLNQIEPVYTHFNVSRSIPWPRASFTIIDQKLERIAEKENIPLEKMFMDINSIRAEHARNTFPEDINEKLNEIELFIDNELDVIADKIGTIDSTLIKSIQKEKGKLLHTIHGIRARAEKAHKSSTEISEIRYISSSYFLNPDGGPQERWFGIDAIVSMLRDRGFDELLELTSPGEEKHRIILPDNS